MKRWMVFTIINGKAVTETFQNIYSAVTFVDAHGGAIIEVIV